MSSLLVDSRFSLRVNARHCRLRRPVRRRSRGTRIRLPSKGNSPRQRTLSARDTMLLWMSGTRLSTRRVMLCSDRWPGKGGSRRARVPWAGASPVEESSRMAMAVTSWEFTGLAGLVP